MCTCAILRENQNKCKLSITYFVKHYIQKSIRPAQKKTLNINSDGIKLLIRLWLGFNHLYEHKFNHLRYMLNHLCLCSIKTKTIVHYFLHFYNTNRAALMIDLNEFDSSFSKLNDHKFIELFFYGNDKFGDNRNHWHKGTNLMLSTEFLRGLMNCWISSQKWVFNANCNNALILSCLSIQFLIFVNNNFFNYHLAAPLCQLWVIIEEATTLTWC